MVSHLLEKCSMIKECIIQFAKEGRIILDLDDIVKANHVSSQTRKLCTLQFGNLEPVVLFEPWLLSTDMKEKSFSVAFLDWTTVNMTLCSDLEEETDEEGVSKENCSGETDKTMAALEAMPMCLNWRQIFSLSNEMCQHMVIALQQLEIYAEKVKGVIEMSETPVQCASCNTAITFTDDDLLLGSKPHNPPLFVAGYIKKQKVDRILVDGGSAVNIMPKSTMHDLGITIKEILKSWTQGFNLECERAIGIIRIKLVIGDLSTSSMFHVIDAKTSYKLLLSGHGSMNKGLLCPLSINV